MCFCLVCWQCCRAPLMRCWMLLWLSHAPCWSIYTVWWWPWEQKDFWCVESMMQALSTYTREDRRRYSWNKIQVDCVYEKYNEMESEDMYFLCVNRGGSFVRSITLPWLWHERRQWTCQEQETGAKNKYSLPYITSQTSFLFSLIFHFQQHLSLCGNHTVIPFTGTISYHSIKICFHHLPSVVLQAP